MTAGKWTRRKSANQRERERGGVESQGCCHGVWYCGYKMDCFQGDRQLKATVLSPLILILYYLKLSSRTRVWETEDRQSCLVKMLDENSWRWQWVRKSKRSNQRAILPLNTQCWHSRTPDTPCFQCHVRVMWPNLQYQWRTDLVCKSRLILFLPALWKDLLSFFSLTPARSSGDLQILSIKATA